MSGTKQHKGKSWRNRRGRSVRPGTAPGLLVPDAHAERSTLHVIAYGPEGCEERTLSQAADVLPLLAQFPVVWLHVRGVNDIETVRGIGDVFKLHPLALEDVVNLGQRAKLEPYDEHLFIVARILLEGGEQLETEQLSLFLGAGFVLTFTERGDDPFEPVRERVRIGQGRVRGAGPDYLTYAILDAVVDIHFPALEAIADRLELLEKEVMGDPDEGTLSTIHRVRHELITIRRDLLPHRDQLHSMIREELPQIKPSTHLFLRDCHDHVNQLIDMVEVYREVSSDLMSAYLSSVSNRMNEVMKVLTIIATLFIPLTFVAGIYGMNFDPDASRWNMPELGWALGYPFALALMVLIAIGMFVFFRRLGWLGGKRRD